MRKLILSLALLMGAMLSSAYAQAPVLRAEAQVKFGQGATAPTASAKAYDNYSFDVVLPNQDDVIDVREDVTIIGKTYDKNGNITHSGSKSYNFGVVVPPCPYNDNTPWANLPKKQPEYDIATANPSLQQDYRNAIYEHYNDSIEKLCHIKFNSTAVAGEIGDLGNFFTFTNAKAKVNVTIDGDDTKSFYYNLAGGVQADTKRHITGAATSVTALEAAINHAKTQTTRTSSTGNQLVIKSGSYIKYGAKSMTCQYDVALSKADLSFDKLMRAVSENTSIGSSGFVGNDTCKMEIFLIAGSKIALRGQLAELDQDLTITFVPTANAGAPIMSNALSDLWDWAVKNDRKQFFKHLANWANCIAGKIEGDQNITIDLVFDYIPWAVVRGDNGDETAYYVANDHALVSGEIGTFCYPFAITQIRGGFVYSLEKRDAAEIADVREITLVEATCPLVAGQPYVFVAKAAALEALEGTDNVQSSTQEVNGLCGYLDIAPTADPTLTPATDPNGGYGLIINNIVRRAKNISVKNGLAYLKIGDVATTDSSAPVTARRLVIGKKDATTDLSTFTTVEDVVKGIENGELVIIKNGVKYNAKGQIVK